MFNRTLCSPSGSVAVLTIFIAAHLLGGVVVGMAFLKEDLYATKLITERTEAMVPRFI